MKILILHQHFNTPEKGGALRSYYLAKALVDKGIQTIVIAGSNEKMYRQEQYDGIDVHYLPVTYSNSFGFFARSVAFLKYMWLSFSLAKKMRQVDYCYAISTPLTVGLVAIWLKRKIKLPFIFEVGDIWPDAPVQMGFINNSILASLLFRLEKMIYRQASSIVALSQPIKEAIEMKIQGKRIYIIPNMADCDFFAPEIKDLRLKEKFNTENKFVVSYIGTAGVANGLDYFLECANFSGKADLPIHFILCGDGALLRHLKASAERLRLKNISFTGFVNRLQVKEVMNVTDAIFVSYRNFPILQTGSPNKYFDGLASGKMIIINFEGWIKTEVENACCGIYLDPMLPSTFVKKIEPFVSDARKTSQFQRHARDLAESAYERKKISDKFVNILTS